MPDDSPDVPGDAQAPEDTVVTCAGGIQIQAPGVTNGE